MMKNASLLALALGPAVVLVAACSDGPTVSGPAGQKLTLLPPSAVTLHRGGMAKADIKIKRPDLQGEVSISFRDLPAGVEVVDAGNKIVGDTGAYTLRASESADLVEKSVAQVTATGPDRIAVTAPISITVKEKDAR